MLVTNRYGNRKDRPCMSHQLILLSVCLCLFWLLWHFYFDWSLYLLGFWAFFFLLALSLSFLFLFHRLHLLVQFYSFFYHFKVFLNLLLYHVIHCQNIVELFGQNKDFNSAIRHTSSHDSSWVWQGDAIELSVRVNQTNRPNSRQAFVKVHFLNQLLLNFLF